MGDQDFEATARQQPSIDDTQSSTNVNLDKVELPQSDNEDDVGGRNEEQESESDADETPLLITFTRLLNALKSRVQEARLYSPPVGGTPQSVKAFQSYWRDIFMDIETLVEADPGIPDFLTEPPTRTFRLWLFKQEKDGQNPSCPCCLPECDEDITLHNSSGITKMDLLRGLRGYLYSSDDDLPVVHNIEDGKKTSEAAFIDDINYMMASSNQKDEGRYLLEYEYQRPSLWVMCDIVQTGTEVAAPVV